MKNLEPEESKSTPEFLHLLLTLELRERIEKNRILFSFQKETIKKLLKKMAWEHIIIDDLEMAEYISQVTNTPIDKIFWEIGLEDLISDFDDREKIYKILKLVGVEKSRANNKLIIESAEKLIIQGYSLEELIGLGFLFESQPYDQKIIDELLKLWKEKKEAGINSKHKHIVEEIPKLIDFIKKYVFTLK
jgi:hypothetical protein